MSKFNWMEITRDDVIDAIGQFVEETPDYPEPRSTYLLYDGKKLPAKHIRGMAYKVHYGQEINKADFGGGLETVKFFERLGFEIDYRGTSEMKKGEKPKTLVKAKEYNSPEKTELKVNNKPENKISISTKRVIEQKNALQLILNKMFDGDIVCEKTYSWLKTPDVISGEYARLYEMLSSYRGDTTFAKKNVVLRCDFVCESKKLIIEYDERQHFSEARKISLESYREIPLCFERERWIKACRDIGAKDNSPKNRDEVRAYYDSTRDIECYKHGYRLIRIMHGQIDFEQSGALEELNNLIWNEATNKEKTLDSDVTELLKVCMYLQCDEMKNESDFEKAAEIIKKSDVDMVVFPEFCYFPRVDVMRDADVADDNDLERVYNVCCDFSEKLGRAVVVNSYDKYGSIYSVFANAFANEDETECCYYMKHTMTDCSMFDFTNYSEIVESGFFEPIKFKGYNIGITICYDCNHALFSRMYELCGRVDLILNSTGGNVVYDKWHKYNKCRAIENSCYTLVTMGGDGTKDKANSYVYGFNANGGELKPENLNGPSDIKNYPGGLYVYKVSKNPGMAEPDMSNQLETINKKWHLKIPVGNIQSVIDKSYRITDNIYRLNVGNDNVMLLLIDGMDIMKPEKALPLLYSPELKKYGNKKYVIVNRHNHIDKVFFKEKLSTILKVRSMENFCAVILEADNINKCYQCGKNRTAQVVKETNGFFGIDLDRTTGPEAIWKNKQGMKLSWRKNYEWLITYAKTLKCDGVRK